MKVIGFEYGTGRNSNFISRLIVSDRDGVIVSGVSSGLNDADIQDLTVMKDNNTLIGTMVDIIYSEISKNKDDKFSLRFPRVNKIVRDDKIEADDMSGKINGR